LVHRLAEKVPLAVVSGASRVEVLEAVEAIGLTSYFKTLLGAEDYQKGKPDPEPFLLGMEKVGASPTGCIVVEDAQPGILAGKAAGMNVIAVRAGNFLGYDQSAADAEVGTLEEVTDALCDSLWSR
jgi:beta-phosphoglucomutase-like phosphatase (HAD superfamily)